MSPESRKRRTWAIPPLRADRIPLLAAALVGLCLASLTVTFFFAFSELHSRSIWWFTGMYAPLGVIRCYMGQMSEGERGRKVLRLTTLYGKWVIITVWALMFVNLVTVQVIPVEYVWAVAALSFIPFIALHAYGGYCVLRSLKSSNPSS